MTANSNARNETAFSDHGIAHEGSYKRSGKHPPGYKRLSWKQLSYDFTQYTTLHGLRYIALRDTFILRRIFWLLLTVTCSSLLVVQIVDRVRYLSQSPVAVNIKINYNQSLQFPAITICNQNAFRATAASDLDLYRLIESMYLEERSKDHRNTSWLLPAYHNISMEELYRTLGHTNRDMIVSCSWSGEKCSADNFSTMLTDHGMCYTFNAFDQENSPLDVTLSGAEHGLRLTLNVEQYNGMPGPHDTNGIKILATAQSEFPRVEEVGVAIPTGAHAFVGLNVLVISNLPKPHGDCAEKPLVSTTKYSPEMCVLECVTRYVGNQCGCRNFYMPKLKADVPVCTVKQYFDCYLDAYDYIHKRTIDECDCPTSCNYLLYESSISYAATSANMKGNLLGLAQAGDLQKKFRRAREITSKMDLKRLAHFQEIVNVTIENYKNLKHLFAHDILVNLQYQMKVLAEWRENMTSSIKEKQTIYDFQEYSIQKNFMRARDAMEERTLNLLCFGFHEHVFQTEYLLKEMSHAQIQNETSRASLLHTMLKNTLQSKIATAGRAFQNYTQIYTAYSTGESIFNYKFRRYSRKNNAAIVPKHLMNSSLTHNHYARRYSTRMGRDIERVMNATLEFEQFTDVMYENTSVSLDITRMQELSEGFIDSCENYFHSKSTFYFECVDRPLRIIQDRIQTFSSLKKDLTRVIDEQFNALRTLKNSLTVLQSGLLYNLAKGMWLAEEYFAENATENVTKMHLAEIITSKAVSNDLHIFTLFFTEMRQKGQFIYEQWSQIKPLTLKIWSTIINDIDSIEYYQHRGMDHFLQNFTAVEENFDAIVAELTGRYDLRNIMQNTDNAFVKALESLTEELGAFLQGNEMGETFVRENFLQLDIYFKELRHEEIEQQRAYDAIALLCDIGGSLGLFIGASVLTIFEIVDFIISNLCRNIREKK